MSNVLIREPENTFQFSLLTEEELNKIPNDMRNKLEERLKENQRDIKFLTNQLIMVVEVTPIKIIIETQSRIIPVYKSKMKLLWEDLAISPYCSIEKQINIAIISNAMTLDPGVYNGKYLYRKI